MFFLHIIYVEDYYILWLWTLIEVVYKNNVRYAHINSQICFFINGAYIKNVICAYVEDFATAALGNISTLDLISNSAALLTKGDIQTLPIKKRKH